MYFSIPYLENKSNTNCIECQNGFHTIKEISTAAASVSLWPNGGHSLVLLFEIIEVLLRVMKEFLT